jgi:hypothetical protein
MCQLALLISGEPQQSPIYRSVCLSMPV